MRYTSELEHAGLFDEKELTYGNKHLKRKLIERHGDHIVFADVGSIQNLVCFRDICSFLINVAATTSSSGYLYCLENSVFTVDEIVVCPTAADVVVIRY